MPADVKFKDGHLKHALKQAVRDVVPRRDRRAAATRWGSPCRSASGCKGELRDFVLDAFATGDARPYLRPHFDVGAMIEREGTFTRNLWGLLSLELWQQTFHDRQAEWTARAPNREPTLARTR